MAALTRLGLEGYGVRRAASFAGKTPATPTAKHIANQIRDAAVLALAGLTTSGSRVYDSRVHRWGAATLPGLAVVTREQRIPESYHTGVRGERKLQREVELMVTCAASVASATDVDDVLDTMSAEVEAALAADPTLGGIADDMVPVSCAKALFGEGERRIGTATLVFLVWTRTVEGAAQTFIH